MSTDADLSLMLRSTQRRLDLARAQIAAALGLHPRFVASNTCVECEAEWPCPTVRALTEDPS